MKLKRLLLLIAFLSIYSINFSQSPLDKGNYQLAGSVSFSKSEDKNESFHDKSLYIQASPQLSYFVIDNLLVGGLLSFRYSEYEWTSPESYLSVYRALSVGPLVKYYFRTESVIPFVGASASYLKYLGKDEYAYSLSFSAGVNYFIAKSLALEPFVQYDMTNYYKPESDQKEFSFGLRLNYFIIK